MTKTVFTTITPLAPGVSRETVLSTLQDHLEMIDLNPAHTSRNRVNAPRDATPEELFCAWYDITDKVSYLPGYSGKVSFKAVFHDLANGVQIHVYAPMGLDIKEKWTIGGNAPGEPVQPVELGIGAPVSGLYLREDVELRCNFMMTRFVRKQLKDALATLVARLMVKSQLQEAVETNKRLTRESYGSYGAPGSPPMHSPSLYTPGLNTPPLSPPLSGGLDMSFPKPYNPQAYHQQQQQQQQQRYSQQTFVSEIDGKQKYEYSPKAPQQGPVELP